MPRLYYLLPLLFALSLSLRAQDTLTATSEIQQVTVYLDGAQIKRTATTPIPAGRATLVFTGLTTDLDPASIQVSPGGNDFTVLAVSHRLNFGRFDASGAGSDELRDRLATLDRQKAQLLTRVAIAKDEEAILQANRTVAGDGGLDAQNLITTVNYHRERLTAIRLFYLAATDSLETLTDERELLQQRIAATGKEAQPTITAEVIVTTQAERATRSAFDLAYLVPNAGWEASYDARVADTDSPVDLQYRAEVHQSTGEDWTDVRLRLSTGDPTTSAQAPTLPSWQMRNGSRPPTGAPIVKRTVDFGYEQVSGTVTDENGDPLVGVTVGVIGTPAGTVTDIDGNYTLKLPAGHSSLRVSYTGYEDRFVDVQNGTTNIVLSESADLLDEVVVVGYASDLGGRVAGMNSKRQQRAERDNRTERTPVPVTTTRQATTVTFDIELPYTIPSDGRPRRVDIQRYDLPATYTHFAVPKLEGAAYLQAAVTDWEQYDLLSGELNLFFEGTFLGASQLDVSTVDDTLTLSLGKDPNVVVERTETGEFRERNFIGSKVAESRAYTISVRNNKRRAITLVIQDQVPVSSDEQIEVKTDLDDEDALDEETGLLTWRVAVPPAGAWSADFGYAVKYPRHMWVVLE